MTLAPCKETSRRSLPAGAAGRWLGRGVRAGVGHAARAVVDRVRVRVRVQVADRAVVDVPVVTSVNGENAVRRVMKILGHGDLLFSKNVW